ncbi:MAG: AAA family ATPase [Anaerolineae bacterium]|nr:AAA family ATPase [Anaerolineae bacterium]
MKPIIFLLGPSGIGKSHLSKMLAKNKFLYVHIDTDSIKRTFAANGFPSEWDDDFYKVNLAHFVSELRDRLDNEHAGVVVSFPTVHVFTPEKLVEAAQLRVTPVVLWGKQEHCIRAAEKRIEKKGGKFNLPRYERLNGPTFRAYGRPEYDAFRVEAFHEDGSRYPDEKWLTLIMERTAG